jgi:hypothetical protein
MNGQRADGVVQTVGDAQMRRIETTVDVGEDRRIVLELPDEIAPGEHRITVLIDQPEMVQGEPVEQPLVRKGSVLVYAGELVGDVENGLNQLREQRLRKLAEGLEEK